MKKIAFTSPKETNRDLNPNMLDTSVLMLHEADPLGFHILWIRWLQLDLMVLEWSEKCCHTDLVRDISSSLYSFRIQITRQEH